MGCQWDANGGANGDRLSLAARKRWTETLDGNAGRKALVGPGEWEWDLGTGRVGPGDRQNLQGTES